MNDPNPAVPRAARDEPSGIGGDASFVAQPFRALQLWCLLGITLLAGALRLLHLSEWSLWVDEAHTWRDATTPLDTFYESYRAWYPASFLGLRWLLDSGVLPQLSEGWLRLPFAFFGIVSVPLLALFGNLLVGRRAALLAALFLAINPWHIYWSQNARGYVLVFFFAVLSAGTFWLGILRGSTILRVLGVLAAFAGGICHLTGLSLLPVFLVHPLLARGPFSMRRIALLVGATVVLILLLPHLLGLLPPFQAFERAKSDASIGHLMHTTAFYFRLPLLCAAVTGMWLLLQTRIQGRVLFLACWALVPLLALSVVGVSVVKVTARYAFCSLPAVMLLAGAASVCMAEALAAGLGRATFRSRLLPAAILPAILCIDMATYDYQYFTSQHGDRGRWREARDLVLAAAGSRQIEVYTVNEPSMLYYLRPNHYRELGQDDPHVGTQVWGIFSWEVARGGPLHLLGPVPPGDKPPSDGGSQGSGTPSQGVAGEGGGRKYLQVVTDAARAAGSVLFFVVSLPELKEIDRDGSLYDALRTDFELKHVLPCWVGPKDETIYLWQLR